MANEPRYLSHLKKELGHVLGVMGLSHQLLCDCGTSHELNANDAIFGLVRNLQTIHQQFQKLLEQLQHEELLGIILELNDAVVATLRWFDAIQKDNMQRGEIMLDATGCDLDKMRARLHAVKLPHAHKKKKKHPKRRESIPDPIQNTQVQQMQPQPINTAVKQGNPLLDLCESPQPDAVSAQPKPKHRRSGASPAPAEPEPTAAQSAFSEPESQPAQPRPKANPNPDDPMANAVDIDAEFDHFSDLKVGSKDDPLDSVVDIDAVFSNLERKSSIQPIFSLGGMNVKDYAKQLAAVAGTQYNEDEYDSDSTESSSDIQLPADHVPNKKNRKVEVYSQEAQNWVQGMLKEDHGDTIMVQYVTPTGKAVVVKLPKKSPRVRPITQVSPT